LKSQGRPDSSRAFLKTPAPVRLGSVDQAKKVPFTFVVPNPSKSQVKIEGIFPSCGCTWLDQVQDQVIEPGASLSIDGILDTDDRRHEMRSNAVLSYRFLPNGKKRDVILTVEADVRPTINVDPELLLLDLPRNGPKISGTVTLSADQLREFTIENIECSVSWISTEILEKRYQKSGSGESVARIKVVVDPSAFPSAYSESYCNQKIKIRTNSESEPILTLPIRLRLL
jgi:hypothetical protein